jgi:hypothetical protein
MPRMSAGTDGKRPRLVTQLVRNSTAASAMTLPSQGDPEGT